MIDMYNLCLMVINRQTFDLYYQSMKYRSPAHSKELIVVLFPLTAFVSSRISFRIKMSSYFAGICGCLCLWKVLLMLLMLLVELVRLPVELLVLSLPSWCVLVFAARVVDIRSVDIVIASAKMAIIDNLVVICIWRRSEHILYTKSNSS